jgi:hypothetical protein
MRMFDALIRGFAAAVLVFMGAGCGDRRAIVETRIEPASVPVAVGCVSGDRPADVAPLQSRFSAAEWTEKTPAQKAAEVAAQGLRHQSYGQAQAAATGACK